MIKGLFGTAMAMDVVFDFGDKPFPAEDQKERAAASYFQTGGNSVNAAFTFAALQGQAQCVVSIGSSSPFRSQVLDDFSRHGITYIDSATKDFELPYSAIALSKDLQNGAAYRTLWTCSKDDHYEPITINQDDINPPNVLMLDLYYQQQTAQLIEYARMRHIPIVVDVDKWNEYYEDILPDVDYVIASEKFRPPGCYSPEDALNFLYHQMGVSHVAITRGHQSVIGIENNQNFQVDVPAIEAVDTLGAGDVFHGAFANFIILNGGDFKGALSLAAHVASISCQHKGHDWMFERKDDLDLLNAQASHDPNSGNSIATPPLEP